MGFTNPEGARLTVLRRRLRDNLFAAFNSRDHFFSRPRYSLFREEIRTPSCWSLDKNSTDCSVSPRSTSPSSRVEEAATSTCSERETGAEEDSATTTEAASSELFVSTTASLFGLTDLLAFLGSVGTESAEEAATETTGETETGATVTSDLDDLVSLGILL